MFDNYRWNSLQQCLDVVDGRDKRIGMSGEILEYDILRNVCVEFGNEFHNFSTSSEEMWSWITTKIRDWKMSKIENVDCDDLFVITLPNKERVQLIFNKLKNKVGVRRINSDKITWIPIIIYPQGAWGIPGPVGPVGFSGSPGIAGTEIDRSDKVKLNLPI